MAVATTGAIYKSLSFDGVESRNFGVYITGEAVYNAPTRDVEMVSIPGRSGAFALDKGRFENIEVTYPAGIFTDNEEDFARAISDFRNYLCSRKGYCRLVDEYNPEEYRMAIYKSGLEVTPAQLKAGEFSIVFDCKPQRYLMSGEAAVDVSDGDTLMNPTMFESSPLLEVEGYGTIGFNGYEIELNSDKIGRVLVADATSGKATVTLDTSKLQAGDRMYALESDEYLLAANITASGAEGYYLSKPYQKTATDFVWGYSSRFGVTYGTPNTLSYSAIGSAGHYMVYNESGEYIGLTTYSIHLVLTYDGDSTLTFSYTATPQLNPERATMGAASYITKPIYSNSTKPITTAFIDCENGNAYCVDNGSIISLNQHVDFGSDLPKLASGPNEITCDNTITSLKVVPRWWKV